MNNPFNKLKVHRDEDDVEQVHAQTKTSTTTPTTLFPNKDDKKPKKKVRPEDKKENVEQKEEVSEEGFEVVGKQKKNQKQTNEENVDQTYDSKPGKKDAPHKFHHKRNEQNFKQGTGQRIFDRHVSGTGRGKEVKKEGRGGRFTWEGKGREIVERDDTDYLFSKVLNSTAEPVQYEEPKVEEKKPEVKIEEKQEVVVPETADDGKDSKKKKPKKGEVNPEEDEKNKLVIPENAMTLKDYKEKAQKSTTNTIKSTPIKVDLEVLAKDEDEHVISVPSNKVGGKKGKKKEKGVDAQEVELNKLIGSSLGYEDSNDRSKKPYQKNYQKNY